MRRGKRGLVTILSLLLISVMMISCGKKDKVSVEESVTILYNVIFKGDSTDFEKIGATKEEIDESLANQKKFIIDTARERFVSNNLQISEDKLEKIYEARCNAFKKLAVKVEIIDNDGKVANVKVGTTYFKEAELDEKAGNDAIETVKAEGLSDEKVIRDRLVEVYVNNLVDAYNNPVVSTDNKYIESKFIIKNGVWEAENIPGFIDEVGEAVIGHDK